MITPIDASLSGLPFFYHGQFFAIAPPGPADSVAIETPTGTIDGSNPTFTVSNAPTYLVIDGSVRFSGFGYTYSGGTITVDESKSSYDKVERGMTVKFTFQEVYVKKDEGGKVSRTFIYRYQLCAAPCSHKNNS